jgi:beta-xylosidase
MGTAVKGQGTGEPVMTYSKPASPDSRITVPATSDEFETSALGRQWQWQANPQPGWASLTALPGSLRLACVPQKSANDTLWSAAHLLLQKFPGPAFVATTPLHFSSYHEGEMAGLIVFGHDYAWIGLRWESDRLQLVVRECRAAHDNGRERTVATLPAQTERVTLRVTVEAGARCRFSYRFPEGDFSEIGGEFQAVSSYWVGAKVGLFAASPAESAARGHADFDWFRVEAR